MDEAGVAQPWQGIPRTSEGEVSTDKKAQGNEQRCHDVAQRTSMVPVCSGINGLEGMQGRMTELGKEHRKAEEHEKSTRPSANAACEPPQLWLSIRPAM